jgi:hypothetical protein
VYTSKVVLNSTQVFQTGVYIFEAGIKATGGSSVSFSSGPGGVLFYVTGGSLDIEGGGGLSLEPLNPPLWPFTDLVIWQDKSDSNQITITGSATVNDVNGTIYAPSAQVGGAGSGNLTVGSIVASSVACAGNNNTTIG